MTNHSTTNVSAKIIPFRQKELLLIDNAGEPFVPMKPVVEGMGLDWKSQYAKLQGGRFNSTMVMITTVAGDGKRRDMACLPLRKLAGWLMSIHASKVRPELREGVIAYQNECDDVLWSYWNDGVAVRHDDRTAASVLSTTIGTDGFHCLAAVVDGKVRHLPAAARRGAKNHIWSQVHKAFSVVSAEDIPAAQLDSARNFIAAYQVQEGEWLPKPRATPGTLLTDSQLYDVYFMCCHFKQLYDIFDRYKLYSHFSGIGSPVGAQMIDHFRDGYAGFHKLQALAPEFEAVQKRLGANHYARAAA
ncbi:phage antirepressor N-terminal domain-containing protein [Stutzerimonas sp. NM35]